MKTFSAISPSRLLGLGLSVLIALGGVACSPKDSPEATVIIQAPPPYPVPAQVMIIKGINDTSIMMVSQEWEKEWLPLQPKLALADRYRYALLTGMQWEGADGKTCLNNIYEFDCAPEDLDLTRTDFEPANYSVQWVDENGHFRELQSAR